MLHVRALQKRDSKMILLHIYNSHIGTACDGSGIGLKFEDEFGVLTLCNGTVRTENGSNYLYY